MDKPKISIAHAKGVITVPGGLNKSPLTADRWLAMFIAQIRICLRNSGTARFGCLFRCAASLATLFQEREPHEDRHLLPYLSPDLL
jgi:hypothetical protein